MDGIEPVRGQDQVILWLAAQVVPSSWCHGASSNVFGLALFQLMERVRLVIPGRREDGAGRIISRAWVLG